jgi:hypothetical protein
MPSQMVTWVGNADERDSTAVINLGVDGSGKLILLRAGKALELTEAQIKEIPARHVLVMGNEEGTIVIRDTNLFSDFTGRLRGKSVVPIGH